jgi:nitrogenase molybdenum-cofactor synthesis protein NifE
MFSGARVVLNPITDAYHIIHGPIGCASYTWDIRGSLTSGAETFRTSYSTDLRETDVIFGGEKILEAAIRELVEQESAKLIFVYGTCIVGVIGDDVDAVCRRAEERYGIRVIPVKASGFSGTKSQGYKLACDAIMELILPHRDIPKVRGINILGDFNLAGEMWIIKSYMKRLGIPVVSTATGDAGYESLLRLPSATLNVVQCAGSSAYLANRMEAELGIPFIKVSFFGAEDTTNSLIRIAQAMEDEAACRKAAAFTAQEAVAAEEFLSKYRAKFRGKKAAIYVGRGFKAISLIKQFNEMGIETVVVGTQTGKEEDYEIIEQLVGPDAVILDDANPSELEEYMLSKGANILVGGVKERPLAYKLGIAFCDHNHERKHALAGFEGIRNFTQEVNLSLNSPVWEYCR